MDKTELVSKERAINEFMKFIDARISCGQADSPICKANREYWIQDFIVSLNN